MKKLILIVLAFSFLLTFTACDRTSDNDDDAKSRVKTTAFASMKTTLTNDGYELTPRTQENFTYYEGKVSTDYSIDVKITGWEIGYVNSTERWVEIYEFDTTADAKEYFDALTDEASQGRLLIHDEYVVLVTYSQETIDLFN